MTKDSPVPSLEVAPRESASQHSSPVPELGPVVEATSPYLNVPPRTEAEARSVARPTTFRFYFTIVDYYEGHNTVHEWAPDAATAEDQLRDRDYKLVSVECDPIPDCMRLPGGKLVPLDRAEALRIMLTLSIGKAA